ncbi:aminotransferase class V-fold PLP-dependent enzyme [Sphingobacterium sp. DK4209]|uniref:cysteine desulfurase n=1 Tax=Sphingobacterium zhuxiongii TaxID=2662364 RepID=A0A5Q0QBK9_9SPHI|nr:MULTISPECIES: cysteine desulfurase family protein [unclassified Sphingobacterium]MVZ66438.1 aminotransferase class V-fold PLP-dependent enzyme [Sphingobacterium sp. DK4209]QGA27285.1 aminotransferase class V-fold PLP-dependent enzyme [Sphingobacterium sp. dk4302]
MHVYFDNAATTALDKAVIDVMVQTMNDNFGNPSSIHAHGRESKTIVEKARRTVAKLLHASPAEIFFTSGGTEADNMAIVRAIEAYGITHAVSSPIEHHAVLHTLEELQKDGKIHLDFLRLDQKGNIDLSHLEELLAKNPRTFVSIMHANNELGNITDIQKVSDICNQYDAVLHSDTVQTMGHYAHDLSKLKIDFITAAAHKFHGPKGVGFLYINSRNKIKPLIHGGAQERNMRGGTENVYGIVGLAKALEMAYEEMEAHQQQIQSLKDYMKEQLIQNIPDISFNGETEANKALYTVLNVSLPCTDMGDMLLFNLDIKGVSASGGSACSSGSDIGSHVLRGIGADPKRPSVRFSFSKFNTKEEVDFVVQTLKEICSRD